LMSTLYQNPAPHYSMSPAARHTQTAHVTPVYMHMHAYVLGWSWERHFILHLCYS
jgi:hypothetical protein